MEIFEDQRAHRRIASAFLAARASASGLSAYPGAIPQTLEDAYAIQDAAIALTPAPIAGWKIGRILGPQAAHFGVDRLAGPILSPRLTRPGEGHPPAMPVFAAGFAAVEAEWLLRLGADADPARMRYTLAEAAELIDAVHVGIEIASSPFAGINDLGAAVTISDFGNNHGLVIGAAVGAADYARWPVSMGVDGAIVGTGSGADLPDGPIGAVCFLLELLAARRIALRAGQWISTGAITGVHPVAPGAQVEARFGADHALRCTIEAARAGEGQS